MLFGSQLVRRFPFGSGTAKPRPDLSISPTLLDVGVHFGFLLRWDLVARDVALLVRAVLETEALHVPVGAHLLLLPCGTKLDVLATEYFVEVFSFAEAKRFDLGVVFDQPFIVVILSSLSFPLPLSLITVALLGPSSLAYECYRGRYRRQP